MKKHGLTKILGVMLLLLVVLSFVLNGRNDTKYFIGVLDLPLNYIKSIYYFFYLAIYVLCLGGFYGVLEKTTAYKKLVDKMASTVKPLGKKFIFLTILVFAIVTSY